MIMSNLGHVECNGIKQCPCCNHKAEMIKYYSSDDKDNWYKVLCNKCALCTRKLSSKAQAKKTWNRRNGK